MLKAIEKTIKEYQHLINTGGILLALVGIYLTFFQVLLSTGEYSRNSYEFKGQQYPTLTFQVLDQELGIAKVHPLQTDMLFQFARVTYHDSLAQGQEIIRMHDSIWFNTSLFSRFKFDKETNCRFQNLMAEHEYTSYLVIRTPVVLEVNYVKYGESRIIQGIFDLEFTYGQNYRGRKDQFKSALRAVYFRRYLQPDIVKETELNSLDAIVVIEGA